MRLERLKLDGFTVFSSPTCFDFVGGVNVLVGENGTGKSHVLKLIYALTEAVRRFATGHALEAGGPPTLMGLVSGMLLGVFQPDSLESFASKSPGRAAVTMEWESARLNVTIRDGVLHAEASGDFRPVGKPIFVPPRELLSIFPGFAAAWINRESSFDRTYYDLCVALDLKPLRSGGPRHLIEALEQELDGKVLLKDGRFFIAYPGADMEIQMTAEGDRKLAMLAQLLTNGSLAEGGYVLWDEPEANLNPRRALMTADLAVALSKSSIQGFLATHSYELASELSLKSELGGEPNPPAAFFALHRDRVGELRVERADTFTGLSHNSILDALAALHAREDGAVLDPGGVAR